MYKFILPFALTLFMLLGCTSDDLKSNSTAGTDEPSATSVTIIDALGKTLSFDNIPTKIATISPTATEMLYAAGGTSVLRDRASNFPESVLEIPHVGSPYDPSIETILEHNPDLVIVEAITQARFVNALSESGLKVMAVKAENVDDIVHNITNIGKIIQKENTSSKTVSEIEEKLHAAGNNDTRSILLLISDQDRNLYAALPESYTGLIAATLGMENKASGLPDSGPYPGFAMMSPELILRADPDIIVTITPAPTPAPRLSATLIHIPPFAKLKSIQNGNIIEADVSLFLQAPGPRIGDAVEFLMEHSAANK